MKLGASGNALIMYEKYDINHICRCTNAFTNCAQCLFLGKSRCIRTDLIELVYLAVSGLIQPAQFHLLVFTASYH